MGEPIREQWITEATQGRTFAEVGGLWGTVNETVTVAAAAGATELTMIDVAPPDPGPDGLWSAFDRRLQEHGVSGVRCLRGNIDDRTTTAEAGAFDVVHCSGVLYHCPEPLHTLRQLRLLTRETLVLGTATMPESISTSAGSVQVESGAAMLVPAMTQSQRAGVAVLVAFFGLGVVLIAGLRTPLRQDGGRAKDGPHTASQTRRE